MRQKRHAYVFCRVTAQPPNIHANWFASPTMKAIPSRVRCAYLTRAY